MLLSPETEVETAYESVLAKLGSIALQSHQFSQLDPLVNYVTTEARELFGADRALIYQFLPGDDGVVLAESVGEGWLPILGQLIYDPCFKQSWAESYRQGRVSAIADVKTSGLSSCHIDLLTRVQVKANLVAPIVIPASICETGSQGEGQSQLWGSLILHQCSAPRNWEQIHRLSLKQMADQVGIAIRHLTLQQSLAQSQDEASRWRSALEGAEDGVWDWNADTNEVYFSTYWKAMLGYADDEIGTSLSEWDSRIHPDDREAVYAEINKHFTGQIPIYRSEHRVLTKAGTWKWVLDRGKVVSWKADGTPLRVVGTHVDISLRKELEAKLQASQQKYQTLFDILPIGISITSADGHLIEANPTSEKLLGISVEEHLQRDFDDTQWQTLLPDGSPMPTEQYPAMIALREHRLVQDIEMGVRLPDGQVRWLMVSAAPLPVAGYGVAIAYSDITQLKQAEALTLLQSEALNACADMIMITDQEGTVVWVNPAFTRLTGYLPEEAIGQNPRHLLKSDLQAPEIYEDLWQTIKNCQVWRGELMNRRKDGTVYPEAMTITPVCDNWGTITHFVAVKQDITQRHAMERYLRDRDEMLRKISEQVPGVIYQYRLYPDGRSCFPYASEAIRQIYGVTPAQVQQDAQPVFECVHPDDLQQVADSIWQSFHNLEPWHAEYRVVLPKRGLRWLEGHSVPERLEDGSVLWHGYIKDITDRKQAENLFQSQVQQEQMLHLINQHMRESLDLEIILQTTVAEVRQFLAVDRVIVYRLNPDWSGVVIAESVAEDCLPILALQITDGELLKTDGEAYFCQNQVHLVPDIYQAGFSTPYITLLESIQVRAKLAIPIFQGDQLWGLLIAHQCQAPRSWQEIESRLLQQLAGQLAIAVQQSELYRQMQVLNTNLEAQVQQRTAELQQALDFEALLKRITDKVRDSLDEQQILQTVVEELAAGLKVKSCDTGIYNADRTTSTIAYEVTHTHSPAQGKTFKIAEAPHVEVYPHLFQGQPCQFSELMANYVRPDQALQTVLACPIVDEQQVLGDLWLFKPQGELFNDLETRLVQQVANQCAIALRQSRLYQAAQAQVHELERLNQLKDDFLSTISHELRTPMATIKMATQMLEMSLKPLGLLVNPATPINRYLDILREEGQREIGLINDLLDLTRFDAGAEMPHYIPINLQSLLPHIAEPFEERIQQHYQSLSIEIPDEVPNIMSDLAYLERCLTELLRNACKYTPAGGCISLSVNLDADAVSIAVSNSGVEILESERDRIFEKFYRIPNHDPWKYSGTGLGLALVKKIVQQLGGTIQVNSGPNQITTFTLKLPYNPNHQSASRI